ncbi:TPA: hypothetical protein HA344_04645 [Candidatus Bathyarchaeota archaeon]|nr:hypothetical protein [Candidatus Bathyarchaeota archaeon]
MVRSIFIDFPATSLSVRADLWEDVEPELCEALWGNLVEPVKMVCRHPVSSGQEFSAEARPPRHPVKSGQGVGRKKYLYTTVPLGGVVYAVTGGFGGLSLYYGPCTEPLQIRGSVVAQVVPSDLAKAAKAGKAVWDAQALVHKPMTIVVRRGTQ